MLIIGHDLDNMEWYTMVEYNLVRGGRIFWGVGKASLRRRVSAALLLMTQSVELGRRIKPLLVAVSVEENRRGKPNLSNGLLSFRKLP